MNALEKMVEAHALDYVPELGEEFFLVVLDDANVDQDDLVSGAYGFRNRIKAVDCARALSNGNVSRKVLQCVVVEDVAASWDGEGRS